jgi:hypothetical protein
VESAVLGESVQTLYTENWNTDVGHSTWWRDEYLKRSAASRNTVPAGITGPPCSSGIQIRGPGSPELGSLCQIVVCVI